MPSPKPYSFLVRPVHFWSWWFTVTSANWTLSHPHYPRPIGTQQTANQQLMTGRSGFKPRNLKPPNPLCSSPNSPPPPHPIPFIDRDVPPTHRLRPREALARPCSHPCSASILFLDRAPYVIPPTPSGLIRPPPTFAVLLSPPSQLDHSTQLHGRTIEILWMAILLTQIVS